MATIKLIGKGIREGSRFLPIRHLAGRATSSAPPKDYIAQSKALYDAITRDWWHYTYDPVGAEVLTVQPEKVFEVTLGRGRGKRSGYGDCDDICIASGALLNSIGFQTIIATTVKPGSPNIFDHVFLFTKPSIKSDWICFDPVMYPQHGFGDITPFKRMALWSLNGKILKKIGPFPPRFDAVIKSIGNCQPSILSKNLSGTKEAQTMTQPSIYDFHDYSDQIGGFGSVPMVGGRPRLSPDILPDFQQYGIAGFGCYNDVMGYTTGDALPHIMAEVDETDTIGNTGLVRTKHFEMDPADYAHMLKTGTPKIGALALADDGEVYVWQPNYDGLGGFFKKLARRVKKRVKKIGKRVKKFAKRIAHTKVFRLGKRILKTAMKYVKPFLKKFGPKIMQAVAPIAAMIPGVGPAVSTALVVGGRALAIAQKAKVILDKFGKPLFKSIKQAKNFKDLLKNEARKLGKRGAASILKKAAAAKGLSGPYDPYLLTEGSKWRTVNAAGFGWI